MSKHCNDRYLGNLWSRAVGLITDSAVGKNFTASNALIPLLRACLAHFPDYCKSLLSFVNKSQHSRRRASTCNNCTGILCLMLHPTRLPFAMGVIGRA